MAKIEDEFYLNIDRERNSSEYPSWILDMYSNSSNPPAFLLEEYWLGHIEDYKDREESNLVG